MKNNLKLPAISKSITDYLYEEEGNISHSNVVRIGTAMFIAGMFLPDELFGAHHSHSSHASHASHSSGTYTGHTSHASHVSHASGVGTYDTIYSSDSTSSSYVDISTNKYVDAIHSNSTVINKGLHVNSSHMNNLSHNNAIHNNNLLHSNTPTHSNTNVITKDISDKTIKTETPQIPEIEIKE